MSSNESMRSAYVCKNCLHFREFCRCKVFVPKSQEAFEYWESFNDPDDDDDDKDDVGVNRDERNAYKFPPGYDRYSRECSCAGCTKSKLESSAKVEEEIDPIFNLPTKR